MNKKEPQFNSLGEPTLVLGATGKTGRRVASRLQALGQPIRSGSRAASPAFDWTQETSWDACLENITSVYVNYPSDLPVLGSRDTISAFVNKAIDHGIRRLVLLSGRGEPEAQTWEKIVRSSGLDWTIIRASWFWQNFSEGAFAQMVQDGRIVLPAGNIPEPFVHIDDITDVAVAALTQPDHQSKIYDVTGPRLLTFAEVAAELSQAMGRTIEYQQIPHKTFLKSMTESGLPQHLVWIMDHLFSTVLDGRNAYLSDGVYQALGRPPKDFPDFVSELTATTTTWRKVA